jgi:hypothetical protein
MIAFVYLNLPLFLLALAGGPVEFLLHDVLGFKLRQSIFFTSLLFATGVVVWRN